MSCKLSDKCDNVFACNVIRPEVELLGCNFYKPKKPMTNEEWFCALPIKDKAKFLEAQQKHDGTIASRSDVDWEVWLKEKHND